MFDLLLVRLKAHASYMSPRIHGTKKREEFIRVMNTIIKNIGEVECDCLTGIGMNRHDGLLMAVEVVEDIYRNTEIRFGSGERDCNFFLEKL